MVGLYLSDSIKDVEKYVPRKGWCNSKTLQKVHPFAKLIVIPKTYSHLFETNFFQHYQKDFVKNVSFQDEQTKQTTTSDNFNLLNTSFVSKFCHLETKKQPKANSTFFTTDSKTQVFKKNLKDVNFQNEQKVLKTVTNENLNLFTDFNFQDKNSLLVSIDSTYGLTEYYDLTQNRWHSTQLSLQLPANEFDFQLELLGVNGNMLYLFGGSDVNDKFSKKVWSRNLSQSSSQWTSIAPMRQRRYSFSSVVLKDAIYALGGYFNGIICASCNCERYETLQDSWSTVAPLNTARYCASATSYDGCIYIAGGKNKEGGLEESVERYQPQSNSWSLVPSMTTARYNFALATFGDRLWAIGGRGNGNKSLTTVESYDPVSESWHEEAPLNRGRSSHAAIDFHGELYVVGGYRTSSKYKQLAKRFVVVCCIYQLRNVVIC